MTVDYVAMTPQGKVFDSSLEKGRPYDVRIGSGQVQSDHLKQRGEARRVTAAANKAAVGYKPSTPSPQLCLASWGVVAVVLRSYAPKSCAFMLNFA